MYRIYFYTQTNNALLFRYKHGITFVAGIIPGTRDPKVTLDMGSILQILRDELLHLQTYGRPIEDAATGTKFNCKAYIVHIASDYRGLEAFTGMKGSPSYHACMK